MTTDSHLRMTPGTVPAAMDPTAQKPSGGLAVLAALLPPAFAFASAAAFVAFSAVSAGSPLRFFQEGGWVTWIALGAAACASVALAVMLYLAARGTAVPPPAMIAVA